MTSFLLRFSGFAMFMAGFCLTHLTAQEPPPSESEEAKIAYVRTWLMVSAEVPPEMVGEIGTFSQPISISLLRAGNQDPEPLIRDGYPYQVTGYFAVLGGRMKIAATSELRNREKVEAMESVILKPGHFYTLLVTGTSAAPKIEILQDSELFGTVELPSKPGQPAPPKPSQSLMFFNFLPDAKFAVEQPGGKIREVSPGAPWQMSGQKELRVAVQETGKDPVLMPLEFDFSSAPSYCVILARDPYNRAAPMVVANGLAD